MKIFLLYEDTEGMDSQMLCPVIYGIPNIVFQHGFVKLPVGLEVVTLPMELGFPFRGLFYKYVTCAEEECQKLPGNAKLADSLHYEFIPWKSLTIDDFQDVIKPKEYVTVDGALYKLVSKQFQAAEPTTQETFIEESLAALSADLFRSRVRAFEVLESAALIVRGTRDTPWYPRGYAKGYFKKVAYYSKDGKSREGYVVRAERRKDLCTLLKMWDKQLRDKERTGR